MYPFASMTPFPVTRTEYLPAQRRDHDSGSGKLHSFKADNNWSLGRMSRGSLWVKRRMCLSFAKLFNSGGMTQQASRFTWLVLGLMSSAQAYSSFSWSAFKSLTPKSLILPAETFLTAQVQIDFISSMDPVHREGGRESVSESMDSTPKDFMTVWRASVKTEQDSV